MSWSGALGVRETAVICGPTAAGKSAIAMALAERTGAVLISADSRQVYRQFDIGTAKPTASDRALVPHLGIDVVEPTERYSAARWVASAHLWLGEADDATRPVIIVGGTGFYLRALETPLFESPPLDPVQREKVLADLERRTTDELRAQCGAVDPARAHLGRTQLLRALETYLLTGTPLSEWLVAQAREATVRAQYLLVDPGESLKHQIATRVQQMLDAGWEAEVAALAAAVPADAPAWNACGYSQLRSVLSDQQSRTMAIERTITETRQYAKRQRTWFRHQLPAARVTHLNPALPDAHLRAFEWWQTATPSEQL
jgi:tRNA dimethylallyltransferase